MKQIQPLDVESVLKTKNPALGRYIPAFFFRWLRKTIHEEELNEFLRLYGHLRDAELIYEFLKYLRIEYKVYGSENIPAKGRYFFVSNHPLGGLDGLVFIYEVSRHFVEIRFPVNDILTRIENLNGIFLPVNKHGAQGREAARRIEEAYASDSQVLYFPAGLCSRKKKGVINDLPWHKSFITKAVAHKRDVVPCYFSGRNSDFFYNLANLRKFLKIRANIEMLWLPDEMFRQKGKTIDLVFGKPIPWQTFDSTKTPSEWAEWVRSETYGLSANIR